MKASYDDIRSLAAFEPLWFDNHGTPRYCEFRPFDTPNIYACEIAFFEIACQHCGQIFRVEKHLDEEQQAYRKRYAWPDVTLADSVQQRLLTYADPPWHDCPGDSMMSTAVRVLEFWRRDPQFLWARVPDLEVEFPKEGRS